VKLIGLKGDDQLISIERVVKEEAEVLALPQGPAGEAAGVDVAAEDASTDEISQDEAGRSDEAGTGDDAAEGEDGAGREDDPGKGP
jgi:hypothetical protein